MTKMKALVYEGPRLLNIREYDIPVPQAGEVLIKVERVGICGSELSGYLGQNSLRKPPLVMGHEFSGSIVAVGSEASAFQVGDAVTVNPLVTCGTCRYCQGGQAQLCAKRGLIGAAVPGAFAEYVIAPEKNTFVLPEGVSFDNGALTEPFACAVHVCRLLNLQPEDRLLVAGAGPIGLFIVQAAQIYGVNQIVVVDLNEERLDIARELGATAVKSVDELPEEERSGFDAAVDAVGVDATRQICVERVRNGGHVIFSGLHSASSPLPINNLIRNEVTMTGAFACNSNDFALALRWIGEGKINMLPWTIHRPLEAGAECFDLLISGPGKVAKILLTLRDEA